MVNNYLVGSFTLINDSSYSMALYYYMVFKP